MSSGRSASGSRSSSFEISAKSSRSLVRISASRAVMLRVRSARASMTPPITSDASFERIARPLLQNHFNPPHAEQAEHAPQQEVEKQRQRNRQRSPQPVPPDRRLRKCAQQIMPHDIEAVRKRNAGEHQDRLRLRCPAEPVVQDHRFDQPIQDRHRKPGVEERIRHPLPRDEIVPLEQRRTRSPPPASTDWIMFRTPVMPSQITAPK